MSKTVEKIDEVTEKGIEGFFTKLAEVTDMLSQQVIEVAPDAAALLVGVVQIKGILEIATSLIVVTGVSIALFYGWKVVLKKLKDCHEFDRFDYLFPASIVSAIGGFVLVACLFTGVLNTYNWMSAIYPEGAIALKALKAAGIDL